MRSLRSRSSEALAPSSTASRVRCGSGPILVATTICVAVAARGHPVADDRLRLAARVAGHPRRVGRRRVDEVAAGGRVGVEHGERGRLVGGPAEHVAAEAEREDVESGAVERGHRWQTSEPRSRARGERAGRARDSSGRGRATRGRRRPTRKRGRATRPRLRRWLRCRRDCAATDETACTRTLRGCSTAPSAAACCPIRSSSPAPVRAPARASAARAPAAWRRRRNGSPQLVETMRSGPIAESPGRANEQHYELPAEFFELFLGPRLKYSCGLWPEEAADLAASEEAMLALSCERAQLAGRHARARPRLRLGLAVAVDLRALPRGAGHGGLQLGLAARLDRGVGRAPRLRRAPRGDHRRRQHARAR